MSPLPVPTLQPSDGLALRAQNRAQERRDTALDPVGRLLKGWKPPGRVRELELALAVGTCRRAFRLAVALLGGPVLAAYVDALAATTKSSPRSQHASRVAARGGAEVDTRRGGGGRAGAGPRTREVVERLSLLLAGAVGMSRTQQDAVAAACADIDADCDPSCTGIEAARQALALLPVDAMSAAPARAILLALDHALGEAVFVCRGVVAGEVSKHFGYLLTRRVVPPEFHGRLLFAAPSHHHPELDDAIAGGLEGLRQAFLRYLPGPASPTSFARNHRYVARGIARVLGQTYDDPAPASMSIAEIASAIHGGGAELTAGEEALVEAEQVALVEAGGAALLREAAALTADRSSSGATCLREVLAGHEPERRSIRHAVKMVRDLIREGRLPVPAALGMVGGAV